MHYCCLSPTKSSQIHLQEVQRDLKLEVKSVLKDGLDGHCSAIERKKFRMSPSNWLFPSSDDAASDGHTSLGSFFSPGRRLKEYGRRSKALPSATITESTKSESKHGDTACVTSTEKLAATVSSDAESNSKFESLPVISAPSKSSYKETRSVSPSVSSTDDHEAISETSMASTLDHEAVSEASSSVDGGSAASNGHTASTGGSYFSGDGSTTLETSSDHGSSAESLNCSTMGESMSQSVGQESAFSYTTDFASVYSSDQLRNFDIFSQDFPSASILGAESRDTSFQGSGEWEVISMLGQRSLYDEHGTIDSSVLQEFLDAADQGSVSTYGGNQSVSEESLLQVDQAIATFRLHAKRLGVSEQDLLKAMYGARPDIAKQYYTGSGSHS
jgi:uncharacterized Zn-binding protein involved in type VI secretion